MSRIIRHFVLLVLLAAVLMPGIAAQAQETGSVNRLSLSEAYINEGLRANAQNPNSDFSIDLQAGQFVINLVVTGANNNTTRFGLTVVPSVINGALDLQSTTLTVNGAVIDLTTNNPTVDATTGSVNDFLVGQTDGGELQSVTVTDSMLTITWLNADPNAPTVTIEDNLFSLTISESSLNMLPSVTNPVGVDVSGAVVDLQPGQALIIVSRSTQPTEVRYTLTPTVINGIVTWQIVTDGAYENGLARSLTTLWTGYFDGIYRDGTLSNTVVTEDNITFTWDLSRQNDPTGDPVTTYTVTEADVNAALANYLTPELTLLSVDMQPSRLVINAAGTDASGASYTAALSLMPVLVNGTLSWRFESFTYNDIVIDTSVIASLDPASALLAGFGSTRIGGTITSFTMDDNAMIITVRY